jgi:hypothetical protein
MPAIATEPYLFKGNAILNSPTWNVEIKSN